MSAATNRGDSVTSPTAACGTSPIVSSKCPTASSQTSTRNRLFDSANNSAVAKPPGTVSSVVGANLMQHFQQIQSRAKTAGDRHFRGGDGQPPFAQIVASAHQSGADRLVQGNKRRFGPRGIHLRQRVPPVHPSTRAKCDPPSSHFVTAHLIQHVAGMFQIHGDAAPDVIHLPQGADQQRGRNGDSAFALAES